MTGFWQALIDFIRGLKWWTVVNPWERAVRVRAGKWTKVLECGWHWRIPFFDTIWLVNSRLRFAPFPCTTISTVDGKTVTAAGTVGFRIVDPLLAKMTWHQP